MNADRSSIALIGRPAPLGATFEDDGVNFALYSANAERVEVCLFDASGLHETARHTLKERTGAVWHTFVPGLQPGQLYGYRVHGPYDPQSGHRFNPNKLLVDPYARELSGPIINNDANFGFERGHPDQDLSFDKRDNAAFMPKCVVVGSEGPIRTSKAPLTPWNRTIIYELHVAGMTRLHPGVPEPLRGTFAGLASDAVVGHLKSLGITAIELLPIFPFADEPHLVAKGLTNYWGYNPYCFFAPDPRLSAGAARAQMRSLVRRYHDAGIEVILDVVYNHTGEGWHLGPTLSLRGIDNQSYYALRPDAPRYYVDDTGCGNTLAVDREPGLSLVLDSLRHWVEEMGVDGFRFDLATTLARTATGFSPSAPLLTELAADPVLSTVKLIVEPWDVGPGGYQLGAFKGPFSEWNDRFRSEVRGFWRGDSGRMGELGTRLTGSSDLFHGHRLGPQASLNFVTAHDGFTLHDLVSYEGKHNEANAENNRDGTNDNLSACYGIEGPCDDLAISEIRARQMRNIIATLLVSQGVPMLLAGDEIGNSQDGNNNAYCQDNPIGWIDWSRQSTETARTQMEFVRTLVRLRQNLPGLRQSRFLTGRARPGKTLKDSSWWSPEGHEMTEADWRLDFARVVGLHIAAVDDEDHNPDGASEGLDRGHILILFNAHDGDVPFRLPPEPWGAAWHVVLDTAHPKGQLPQPRLDNTQTYTLFARSLAILVSANASGDLSLRIPDATSAGRSATARPVEPATLDRLSRAAGIELSYWDLKGRERVASVDTKRSLLDAMGFATSSEQQARDAYRSLDLAPWQRLLPSTTVVRQPTKSPTVMPITIPATLAGRPLAWRIVLEGGSSISGESLPRTLPTMGARRIDGDAMIRLGLPLPHGLPDGMHRIDVEIAGRHATGTLVLAPPHAYRPDWLADGQRQWGLACQLYGLRQGDLRHEHPDLGIGDFTRLSDLARLIGRAGGMALGINPLHAPFLSEPKRASPYSPSSRLHLNPLYIDIAAVPEFADCEEARAMLSRIATSVATADLVAHPSVAKAKLALLDTLFAEFERRHPSGIASRRHKSFDEFSAMVGNELQRFATFQALEEQLGPPSGWPAFYATHEDSAVAGFASRHADRCRFYAYLQFEADRQMGAAARAARDDGMTIGLYGDLAVGAAPDGAEVWSSPAAFARSCRFGAPPDPFSETGQDWGMPPMNPHDFAATGFNRFADLLSANMRHAGALRLDHVMWLERMFWIPSGGTAKDGAYVRYPREDLLGVLSLMSHRHKCLVIGEDLGTVPAGFRECMEAESVFSYRFVRFERSYDGRLHPPQSYPRIALATPASHDLATLHGFWLGRDIDAMLESRLITAQEAEAMIEFRAVERRQLVAALTDQKLLPVDFPVEVDLEPAQLTALIDAVHGFLARTPSALVMANIEDLCGVADQTNLPGTIDSYPNWRRRLPFAVGDPVLARRLRETAAHFTREGRGPNNLIA